ncbi:MAG TPA: aldehyde dehydrogenase family protein [Rhabdochlamydiaceae bacterium]|jgi:acyl-CoA reductase-like NAD-dependent aldehyde dehydrogenase|nr:aldehyde dehydrogenase family protein [Rhabdochlamydiaceae bacterium]
MTSILTADPILEPRYMEELSNRLIIDGKLILSEGISQPIVHPATLQVVGHLAEATASEIAWSVSNAAKAQNLWAKISPQERGVFLRACTEKLRHHREELAYLLTLEAGKPIRTESIGEVNFLIKILDYYSGLGTEIKGETAVLNSTTLMYTLREPIGVVAAILAWNVPLALMAYKIGPSLMAGNTVVVKPAEEASLSVLQAALIMQACLPPGVLNIITGSGEKVGQSLIQHPAIQKVTFTGSVETGRLVSIQAANRLIPVSLELGGKSPMIVCEDTDLEEVAKQTLIAMRFTRQGQSCTATSRIFIHRNRFDDFCHLLKTEIDKMIIGNPFDQKTDIGTVISAAQFKKIQYFLDLASREKEARITYCSALPQEEKLNNGWFLQPALITGISHHHEVVQEEIFGPVACLFPWDDLQSVTQMANDTRYGLAATIWTHDLDIANFLIDNLKAGLVQINQHLPVQPGVSFGGYKYSGFGKEASLEAMLDYFTQKKTVLLKKPESIFV